jgi:hypothetical protein
MDATTKIYESTWNYTGHTLLPEPNIYDTQEKWNFTLLEEMHTALDALYAKKLESDSGARKPDFVVDINLNLKDFIFNLNNVNPDTGERMHPFGYNAKNDIDDNKIYICDGDDYALINITGM